MNIEQLQYICMVAQTHSITTAAEQLYVTQQTISKAINKLETELEVRLLNRSHRGVTLTSEGEVFVAQATEIVDRFQKLYNTMRPQTYAPQLEGTLSFYMVSYVFARAGSEILSLFHKKHPKIRLEISEKLTSDILAVLLDEQVGVGLISAVDGDTGWGSLNDFKDDLVFQLLYEDELQIFVSKNSKLAKKTEINFGDLDGLFAGYGYMPGTFYIVEKRYGVKTQAITDSANITVVGQAVQDEIAFGVTTKGIAARDVFYKDFILLSLDDHPTVQVYFLHSTQYQPNELELILLEEVEKIFAAL